MSEIDKKVDRYIREAKQHLDNARELKSEGLDIRIRALEKAKDSVDKAIDVLSDQQLGGIETKDEVLIVDIWDSHEITPEAIEAWSRGVSVETVIVEREAKKKD